MTTADMTNADLTTADLTTADLAAIKAALVQASNEAGAPARDLALAAEGNISHRIGDDRMIVKASGCSLADLTAEDLLLVDLGPLRALIARDSASDAEVTAAYAASLVEPGSRRPSVEAVLHAVLLDLTGAACILHTHPTAINVLLCSRSAEVLVGGAPFPDAIVMLGEHQVLVPYADPGFSLARAVRDHVQAFMDVHGAAPRVVYLRNHGVFVLAGSPAELVPRTLMADKVARVLHGALLAGGIVTLTEQASARIESRPDEHYRRRQLERRGSDDAA